MDQNNEPEAGTSASSVVEDMDTQVKSYVTLQRKRKLQDNDDFKDDGPWATTEHFKDHWLTAIRTHQTNLIPVTAVNNNKHWFEYLPAKDAKKSR